MSPLSPKTTQDTLFLPALDHLLVVVLVFSTRTFLVARLILHTKPLRFFSFHMIRCMNMSYVGHVCMHECLSNLGPPTIFFATNQKKHRALCQAPHRLGPTPPQQATGFGLGRTPAVPVAKSTFQRLSKAMEPWVMVKIPSSSWPPRNNTSTPINDESHLPPPCLDFFGPRILLKASEKPTTPCTFCIHEPPLSWSSIFPPHWKQGETLGV